MNSEHPTSYAIESERIRDTLRQIEIARLRDGYRQRVSLMMAGIATALTAGLSFWFFSGTSTIETQVREQVEAEVAKLQPIITENIRTVPIGAVTAWPAPSELPRGWVHCDGRQLPASDYPKLAAVLGQLYGQSEGMVTVPDYRGYFLRGVDPSGERDPDFATREGGSTVGSTQEDTLRAMPFPFSVSGANGSSSGLDGGGARFVQNSAMRVFDGRETRPKNIYVHWIIRTR